MNEQLSSHAVSAVLAVLQVRVSELIIANEM